MMLKLRILLFLTACLLAGCGQVIVFGHTIGEGHAASEVKTDTTSTTKAAVSPGIQAVSAVTLTLTPQAAEKIDNDSKFNADALLVAIKDELRSRQLLDDTDSHANGTAEISIDDFALRPTSNVILFGYIISAGTLNGDMRVRGEHGNDLQSLRIEAAARVSIAASGETTNPLGPLYRQFAVLVGNSLAGSPAKSNVVLDQPPR